jgi:hypothetical protein
LRILVRTQSGGFQGFCFLERRKEFIQEGQRWFDLVRQAGQYWWTHKISSQAGCESEGQPYPIPLTEIQLNPLLTQIRMVVKLSIINYQL